ncbi:hypothetical protein [Campylobacter sp. RM16192]|uniref:hypothetical protein n=1 Tax=Campylobacter sp. RM16192 TaxID=1660080 RepID=UPI00145177A8|nr:hypothetical protein [Campylobacter sp. RM16192]QCD52526.1 hypothetical protein CDOMC_0903 [Campylobacter sp. RM16192]
MTKHEFTSKLKAMNLSVADFAATVGLNPASVRSFNDEKRPVPDWIESWLANYEKAKAFDELLDLLEKFRQKNKR